MASSGNFCVLTTYNTKITSYTTSGISNGGTRLTSKTGNAATATFGFRQGMGKYYFELTPTVNVTNSAMMGFAGLGCDFNNYPTSGPGVLYNATNGGKSVSSSSTGNMGSTSTYGATWTNGDVIGCAVDWTNSTIEFYKNNASQGSISISGLNDGTIYYPAVYGNVHVIATNFGADSSFQGFKTAQGNSDENGFGDFYYTPPSGYLAMCSANLPLADAINPAETDDDYSGTKQCNAIVYTGNDGTTSNNINYGFKPDLVIHKDLDGIGGGYPPNIWDTTRGDDYYMYSTGTAASVASDTTSLEFTSTGVKLDNNWDGINHNGGNYISYGWRANGGTTSSNSNGSITSTVQANQNNGFSIVKYTGGGSDGTVGHGLSSAPEFVISKKTSATGPWYILITDLGVGYAKWESTAAYVTGSVPFGSSLPTSTVVGASSANVVSSADYLYYCWHSVPGFSSFGTYVGSGSSTNGTYIDCGFRPKIVWIKKTSEASTTYGWPVFIDGINDNVNKQYFKNFWQDTYVGASSNYGFDFTSQGFKHRNGNTNLDASGKTYFYAAWADTPGKFSNAF